jgi:hypothetical protein
MIVFPHADALILEYAYYQGFRVEYHHRDPNDYVHTLFDYVQIINNL